MLPLPLDATDDSASPAFKDAASCAQWLGQLQLTNLHRAHAVLRAQVDEFNRFPLPAIERLQTLELLRETVSFVQADYAQKLVAKKLPLSSDELTIFVAIVGLWQGMLTGYLRCLQACDDGDAQLAQQGALLCQRCLAYGGLQIFEHLRTGYEFDGKLWRQLHALYAYSEERGLPLVEVADNLNPAHPTSCSATYAKTLLVCHVHRAELTRHQLHLLDRWLTLWGDILILARQHTPSDQGEALALAIDLDSSQGLQLLHLTAPSNSVRYLEMASLARLVHLKLSALLQGQSPQQLGLGEGSSRPDCEALLNHVHQLWGEGRDNRKDERHNTTQQAQMCYGLDGCFAYIANKPFKQPTRSAAVDTLSRKQLAAFGRVLSDTDRHDLSVMGFMLETWLVEDESIRGARLLRRESSGVRLSAGQLVAVRPTNANAFMVGTIIWVKVTLAGQLHAGVRYLPGLPQAIAMKATGINLTVSDQYVAALLLPAVSALKVPPSLLAPRNWFKPGRVVELVQMDKQKLNVKMGFSVERGSDYERISFSVV